MANLTGFGMTYAIEMAAKKPVRFMRCFKVDITLV
jgi:hypothetical protein